LRISLKKNNVVGLFILYIVLLFNFVTLKFFGSFDGIERRIHYVKINRELGYWNYNLEPFKTIYLSIKSYLEYSDTMAILLLFLNIIAFIPMGLLISLILRKPSFFKTFLISLSIVIILEILQFVTSLGIADVDDVILNILGCVIGHFVYKLVSKFKLIKTYTNKPIETA